MTVLFLHGLGAKLAGIKPTLLRQRGFTVVEPFLPHGDFEESVNVAQTAFEEHAPRVVIGDCRGGAVALALQSSTTPQVLIAPAWRKWGNVQTAKANTVILHSAHDTTIPVHDSLQLARNSDLPNGALRIVGIDHFMEDEVAAQSLMDAVMTMADGAVVTGATL